MRPVSLLDNQSDQPEDHIMATTASDDAALNDLTLTVKVIASNYATKEELAVLSGKLDVLTSRIDDIPSQLELAINQQTWRMAAFGSLLISAGFAFARYL